jgi:hypothetical protein
MNKTENKVPEDRRGSCAQLARWYGTVLWLARVGTLLGVLVAVAWRHLEREHPRLLFHITSPKSARAIQIMEPIGLRALWYVHERMTEADAEVLRLALAHGRSGMLDTNWCMEVMAKAETENWFLPGLAEYRAAVSNGGLSFYYERLYWKGDAVGVTNGVIVLRDGEILFQHPAENAVLPLQLSPGGSAGPAALPWLDVGKAGRDKRPGTDE